MDPNLVGFGRLVSFSNTSPEINIAHQKTGVGRLSFLLKREGLLPGARLVFGSVDSLLGCDIGGAKELRVI